MEMTGLEIEREVVIEVAAIVADLDFKESAKYHAVIKQPREFLERMDDWNKKHHGASGLTALVPNGREPHLVEEDLLQLVAKHFDSPAVIAGNSISQDRMFINKYFPKLAAKLHYRMLDVTSWKVVLNSKYGIRYEKKNSHRAIDDIRESMAELKHYLQHVSAAPLSQ